MNRFSGNRSDIIRLEKGFLINILSQQPDLKLTKNSQIKSAVFLRITFVIMKVHRNQERRDEIGGESC